jgi:very-short-patch-repair endonuclease
VLAAIAARQFGVVSGDQLRAVGLDHDAVSKRVAKGRLHRVHRGVYAVGHRGLSHEGRWLAAVLACGEGAALSHLSAAALWELHRHVAPHSDVVAPRRRRPAAGIQMHLCRRLDRRDVTAFRGIQVTTVARTLVDLSDVLDAHQLANIIHEAAFRKRFSVAATRAAMARANGRHNLAVLAAALEANAVGSAGTRSRVEEAFLALVRSGGVAESLVNVHVRAGSRRIEVDFHWFDLRLCVETDGDGHRRPRTLREDELRDRALDAAGYQVLRFTGDDVEQRADWVLARLRAAIQDRTRAGPPAAGLGKSRASVPGSGAS